MAGAKGRRHRTGVANAIELRARVDPTRVEALNGIARALGISTAAFVDRLLEHELEQLDERGLPLWWTGPVAADQEELPLRTA